MGVIEFNPKVATTVINHTVVGFYLLFRQAKAFKTVRLPLPDHAQINIDVDRRNVPIGIEITHVKWPVERRLRHGGPKIDIVGLLLYIFSECGRLAEKSNGQHHVRDAFLEDLRSAVSMVPPESEFVAIAL